MLQGKFEGFQANCVVQLLLVFCSVLVVCGALRLLRGLMILPFPTEAKSLRASLGKEESKGSASSGRNKEKDVLPAPIFANLPRELVLRIMQPLPGGALWSFRQSSQLCFRLFNGRAFKAWHTRPGPNDRYARFDVQNLSAAEREQLKRLFHKDNPGRRSPVDAPRKYCQSCLEIMDLEERDPRKRKLRETRYCTGCKQRHLCVFFPPDSIAKFDNDVTTELHCVGRIGTATICSRKSAVPITWDSLGKVVKHSLDRYTFNCIMHWDFWGSGCPWLEVEKPYTDADPASFELLLGWDKLLLKIDSKYISRLTDVKKALAKLVESALVTQKPCRHMADGHQIRAFAHSGICECFCSPGIRKMGPRYYFDSGFETTQNCKCRRIQYLICKECSATYAWYLKGGHIVLSYRYKWDVMYPTSPAWINMLDQGPEEFGMFTNNTKHLLWCDNPDCDTSLSRRWEGMIKEAIWLQHRLYGKESTKNSGHSKAWEILTNEHRYSPRKLDLSSDKYFCIGGFQLPSYLVNGGLEAKILRKEIEMAAVEAQGH